MATCKNYNVEDQPKNYEVRVTVEIVTGSRDNQKIRASGQDFNASALTFKAGEFVHGDNAMKFSERMCALVRNVVHLAGAHSDAERE